MRTIKTHNALACLLLLLASVNAALPSNSMAIFPFENRTGRDGQWFSMALAEHFRAEVGSLEQVQVFSRDDVRSFFPGFDGPENFTDEAAFQAGKVLGAEKILLGYYTVKGDALSVVTRLLQIEKQIEDTDVQALSSWTAPKTNGIREIFTLELSGNLRESGSIQAKIVQSVMSELHQSGNLPGPEWNRLPAETAAADSDFSDPELRQNFLSGMMNQYVNPDSAAVYYTRALSLKDSEVFVLYSLSLLNRSHREYDEALRLLYQAEQRLVVKKQNGSLLYAEILGSIGDTYMDQKKLTEATESYDRALEALRAIGALEGPLAAQLTIEKGHAAFAGGNRTSAYEYFLRGRRLLHGLHFEGSRSFALALHRLGDLGFELGRLDEALTHYEQSLQVAREMGDQDTYSTAGIMNNIGNCHLAYDHLEKARETYSGSREILEKQEYGRTQGYALVLSNLGVIERKRGNASGALKLFFRAREILDALNLDRSEDYARLTGNIGVAFADSWKLDSALAYYDISLRIRDSLGLQNTTGYAQVLHGVALVYQAHSDKEATLDYLGRSRKILEGLGQEKSLQYADLMTSLGYMAHVDFQPVTAMEYYNTSRQIRESLGLKKSLDYAMLLQHIGQVYKKHYGRPCNVLPYEKRAVSIKEKLGYGDRIKDDYAYLERVKQECAEGAPGPLPASPLSLTNNRQK